MTTVAGIPQTRGFFEPREGRADESIFFEPEGLALGPDGSLYVADTGNHRVRRLLPTPSGEITGASVTSTVIGDGTAASSGEGSPARGFPIAEPKGLAFDPFGNLVIASQNTLRLIAAGPDAFVSDEGQVVTIYGRAPRDAFPADVTRCLTGVTVLDPRRFLFSDACQGFLLSLERMP